MIHHIVVTLEMLAWANKCSELRAEIKALPAKVVDDLQFWRVRKYGRDYYCKQKEHAVLLKRSKTAMTILK